MHTPDLPEWLTITDLAEWLQLPVGTLYQANSKGTAPRRYKIGRSVRYHRADVMAWLDQRAA